MTTFEEKDQKDNEKHADGIVEDRKQAPPPYFTILFFGLILWGVAFCAYYMLGGWSSQGEFADNMSRHQERYAEQASVTTTAEDGTAQTAASADGASLFAELCAVCHSADGSGGIGPDLTGDYKYGKTSADISESIRNGRPGGMPAFGTQLSNAEVEALAAHLLSL